MATLDAELRTLLVRKNFFDQHPATGRAALNPDESVFIALKFHGDVAALIATGFYLGNVVGSVAYGRTTLAGLQVLARHPQVEFIDRQRRTQSDLDDSVPDIKADQVWSRSGDTFSGYTGRGVIVGIIDTGIDIRHHAFRKPDGTTRVLKIWDQTLTPEPPDEKSPDPVTDPQLVPQPTTLSYGVEYDEAQINDTLEATDLDENAEVSVRHVDQDSHGSHVAGIAAGDGSQGGACHGVYHYVGVAPQADIMAVRLWGLTEGDENQPNTVAGVVSDAVLYLMNAARKAQKTLVINASLGRFTDQMDGTTTLCQSIDELLRHNSVGRSMVFSAGNEAGGRFRAHAVVPSGADNRFDLRFTVQDGDTKARQIVVRYIGASLNVRLTSPVAGPDGVVSAIVGEDVVSLIANADGEVSIANEANRIVIGITPPAGGVNAAGTWSLEFTNIGPAPTTFDAFSMNGSSRDWRSIKFVNAVTTASTLNALATGFETIAVGSYRVGGRLAASSGRGPTLDARPNAHPKPELAAPGVDITSAAIDKARSCIGSCCCDCCRDFYIPMSGTSMSAPHVTGAIALMLHKNPALTHIQIRDLLVAQTIDKPDDSTPEEDRGWGAGRLDAELVVEAVTQVNPPLAEVQAPVPAATAQLTSLHQAFLATEHGPQLQGFFERYATEVWSLIQRNRRVATIWQRCKGPIWVRFALQAMHMPLANVPVHADGVGLRDGLRRFARALQRFGSPALRADVVTLEPAFACIEDGMSLQAIIQAIGNRSSHVRSTPPASAGAANDNE